MVREDTFSGTSEEWETEQEQTVCRARPSKRSSARCEMSNGHDTEDNDFMATFHAGRTQRGYWKFWPAAKEAEET